jgi:hypothetical protein
MFFMDTSRPRRSTFRWAKNTEPDARTITQIKGRIVARIITSIIYAAKSGASRHIQAARTRQLTIFRIIHLPNMVERRFRCLQHHHEVPN